MDATRLPDYDIIVNSGLSLERFAAYCLPTDTSEQQGVARYLWNMALSEALYPVLAALEVSLRNSVHRECTRLCGTDQWYDTPGLLELNETRDVDKAKSQLVRRGKPVNAGRVIAEVTFGFWTSLFNLPYERRIWYPIIKRVFPHSPAPAVAGIKRLLHGIRKLRNRVFHYERICHWNSAERLSLDVREMIGWINQDLALLLAGLDRYPEVYRRGEDHFFARLP